VKSALKGIKDGPSNNFVPRHINIPLCWCITALKMEAVRSSETLVSACQVHTALQLEMPTCAIDQGGMYFA
jgi:hypothetical protein